ncbi:DUF4112 domain-containing protein [Pseudooceanicola sp. CBS1P-1]|uniref:DUF4112 domain-containing protein n=1 Tax=Pseudooceanicola albus TaxID=2692189 RepID=A0A6L7G175_9RHOB|nr:MULTISPECIES: DUF4112 domain-containing protein [Pseudooceanicola]MBT9383835.1 DUF4112 domain-containing protein [Pseudooceanicola endophyticus]MXN17689.1 DUF4112 domain-containing protein [Pseudooceanicola albus]
MAQTWTHHASRSTRAEDLLRLQRLERLARGLDAAFRLPGTRIRFGWDGLVGLVPWLGDTLTLLPTLWIVIRAWEMGIRKRVLVQMAGNIMLDWLLGMVPVLGDIFDIGWKANLRNVALMRRELEG